MAKLEWYGFKMGDQQGWDGQAEAGVETFNSNKYGSFIREMFQNSIDARNPSLDDKTPVKIFIELKRVSSEAIPK